VDSALRWPPTLAHPPQYLKPGPFNSKVKMDSADGKISRDLDRKLLNIELLSRKHPAAKDKSDKMRLRRQYLLHFLAICLFIVGVFSTAQVSVTLLPGVRPPRIPTVRDQQRIQALLNDAEPSSLHGAHEHVDKYKHGRFREDKSATVIVNEQTVEVASGLVELAKRQAGTSSNGTVVPPATSTTAVTTEATSTVVTSITSSTVVTETSDSSSPVTQESTSETTSPSTTTETSTGTSSSEVVSSSNTQTTPTSKDSSGSQSSSHSPTSHASVTSFDIYTTTLANGKPTTVTATTVVPAGQADQTPVGGSPSKTNPGASLQTNGARTQKIGRNMILGVIGILFFSTL